MPEVALQTLDLVGRELNNTLGEARTALETFVEQPENVVLLQRCVSDLHQVQGVLRLLEIFGAALLAEEMEQVTLYLLTPAAQKNQAETLDALMRAMVQLPSYVERVLAGGRDLALVLLPLLNDLRAVRGSPLLSEGTLLLLNLKSDQQAAPVAPDAGEPALTVAQWARRLRTRFQLGLVGWIRGERPEQNLEILETVAHQLEQVATRQSVFQLWWVVGAIDRSAARRRPRNRRLRQTPAGPRRSRNPAALHAGRRPLLAEPAGRAAQQSSLLRRARHQQWSARSRRCAPRSGSTNC